MNFDLTWDTYDFHTNEAYAVEAQHQKHLDKYYSFIEKNPNSSLESKLRIRQTINNSFDKIISVYCKQIQSISEILDCHNKGEDILKDREVELQTLMDLKSVTTNLLAEVKNYQIEINNFLR